MERKAAGDDATEGAENLCKEEQELGHGGRETEESELEKESPSASAFDDLLSGDALAAFSNKCSNLLPLLPVWLSHLQFLLGLSALAFGVAMWCVLYFFAF